ncbi:hypothetical protein OUZ56_012492 [Daphnia magna]|uniref:Uncharacterized protein n=1 Tax=Daphnia magna TaxID=35525 RepID=A0ABQ9Z356_9CRUS|nr:hypothetical protein OUZ56_012492 [Daphnia magna]
MIDFHYPRNGKIQLAKACICVYCTDARYYNTRLRRPSKRTWKEELYCIELRARMPTIQPLTQLTRSPRHLCLIQHCLQTQQLFPSRRSVSNLFRVQLTKIH